MSDTVCECGHAIDIHDFTGCNFPRPYAPDDCMCELSPDAIKARQERDALRKQLDEWKAAHDNLAQQLSTTNDLLEIAVEALEYAKIYVNGHRILQALAEIKKLEEK